MMKTILNSNLFVLCSLILTWLVISGITNPNWEGEDHPGLRQRSKARVTKRQNIPAHSHLNNSWNHGGELPAWRHKSELRRILLSGYDKQEAPRGSMDGPANITIGIYIVSFDEIEEATMHYRLTMYLRQSWCDPRLRYRQMPGFDEQLNLFIYNEIWTPDLYFKNEKDAHIHQITVPNQLLFLRPSGCTWYAMRISAELYCPMDLRDYPFDTQVCPMYFETFSHTTRSVTLSWMKDKAVESEGDETLRVPQFQLEKWITETCDQKYISGTFPCLRIRFKLRREYGTYVMQIFLPSSIFVGISWIGFWINPAAVPARCMICMLATVALAVSLTSSKNTKVSYVMAVDIWFIACLVFVLLSFVEYAAINMFHSRPSKRLSQRKRFRSTKKSFQRSKTNWPKKVKNRRLRQTEEYAPWRKQCPKQQNLTIEEQFEIDLNLGFGAEAVDGLVAGEEETCIENGHYSDEDEEHNPYNNGVLPWLDEDSNTNTDVNEQCPIHGHRKTRQHMNSAESSRKLLPSEVAYKCTKFFSHEWLANNLDNVSRFAFPIGFGIFGFVYFFYYLIT